MDPQDDDRRKRLRERVAELLRRFPELSEPEARKRAQRWIEKIDDDQPEA